MTYKNMADVAFSVPGNMSCDFVASLPNDKVFTIREIVEKELEFQGKKEVAPCAFFEETAKYIKINGSRSQQLLALFGEDLPIGKKVKLGVEKRQVAFRAAE